VGDELYFETITEAGKMIDSGTVRRAERPVPTTGRPKR